MTLSSAATPGHELTQKRCLYKTSQFEFEDHRHTYLFYILVLIAVRTGKKNCKEKIVKKYHCGKKDDMAIIYSEDNMLTYNKSCLSLFRT